MKYLFLWLCSILSWSFQEMDVGMEMLVSWKDTTWLVVYATGPGFNPPTPTNHSVDKALVPCCACYLVRTAAFGFGSGNWL